LYVTFPPVLIALLGHARAQISQFSQKLCKPKSMSLSGARGMFAIMAAALKLSPR